MTKEGSAISISTSDQLAAVVPVGTVTARRPDQLTGIALMTGSAMSNQIGAASAALAFPVLGPAGVVAIRQCVAGAVLMTTVRPRLRAFTGEQWRPVVGLALIFAIMNFSLYVAIDTIGLGLAVTIEFLGPLSVALLASRRMLDLGCALIAGAAVVVLARPQPSTDYLGICLALLAAVCWAAYILVNRVVGARVPGSQGPAAAAGLSALLYVPVGIWALVSYDATWVAMGHAASAGILCSAVPMVADLLALRRVPARFFGVFMSVNPVFAALTGLIVLGQSLQPADWLAIAAIVSANAVSVSSAGNQTASADVRVTGRRPRVPGTPKPASAHARGDRDARRFRFRPKDSPAAASTQRSPRRGQSKAARVRGRSSRKSHRARACAQPRSPAVRKLQRPRRK